MHEAKDHVSQSGQSECECEREERLNLAAHDLQNSEEGESKTFVSREKLLYHLSTFSRVKTEVRKPFACPKYVNKMLNGRWVPSLQLY